MTVNILEKTDNITYFRPRERRNYVHLHTVFKQRLSMQSVQRLMETKFSIKNPNLLLNDSYLINVYQSFDEEKKHRFAHDLGGPTNTGLTKNYLEKLVRNNK